MKLKIGRYEDTDHYEATITTSGEVHCEDVFNGIGIATDQGEFGIAQRDAGIEVCLDGVLVWSSTSGPVEQSKEASAAANANDGLTDPSCPDGPGATQA